MGDNGCEYTSGSQLGEYLLGPMIMQTTFAQLFTAASQVTGEKVVIKIMERSPQKDQLYLNETNALSILSHPNIIRLIDHGSNDQITFIITPFFHNGDLYDFCYNHGPLSEEAACKVAYQVMDTLSYLHSMGMTHRDIKPENILIDDPNPDAPRVCLIDFGFTQDDDYYNNQMGSLLYMAPEILNNEPYDQMVDVWAFGVTAYFLLTNNSPFPIPSKEEELEEFKLAVFSGEYYFDEYEFEGVSDEAKDFVTCCLQVDPNRRIKAQDALQHPWFTLINPEELQGPVAGDIKRRASSICSDVFASDEALGLFDPSIENPTF